MKKIVLYLLIATVFSGCFEEEEKVIFYIEKLNPDRGVVAQKQKINISAEVELFGKISTNEIGFRWNASEGRIQSSNKHTTFWEAPDDYVGEVIITLNLSYLEQQEEAETYIKVVKSPAEKWGSISGYLIDDEGKVLNNILVKTITGEEGETDDEGFFYIGDIPQGESGLVFSNVEYDWVANIPGDIVIEGGCHKHLESLTIFKNNPPEKLYSESLPKKKAKLYFSVQNPSMYRHYELYRSTSSYSSSDDGTFMGLHDPTEDYILVEETRDDYYYAVKAVPYNGVTSERSEWLRAYFHDAIDPDANYSFFESDNFFETTLSWRLTGYENEYKGFQVARLSGGYWRFFSEILPPSHTSYFLNTVPGQSGTYYVIAINKDGTYNNSQPQSQRILLEIPELQDPGPFYGSYHASENAMELKWNQLSQNVSWYSGFKIERTSVIPPEEEDWHDLIELNGPYHTTYTDNTVTNGIKYMYRIRSFAIPPGGGTPEFSGAVTITRNAF